MTTHHERRLPVILITGTPGTGKTLHSILLSQHLAEGVSDTPMQHLNVGDIVKEKGFHEGWDEEWQSWIVDEDRLLDYLEEVVNPPDAPASTGFIIDHHDPSLFPERWIDLAVVLTCDNGVLHERLTERQRRPGAGAGAVAGAVAGAEAGASGFEFEPSLHPNPDPILKPRLIQAETEAQSEENPTTDTSLRNYPSNKLSENLTAEIMQTVLAETRESYDAEIIVELSSSGLAGEAEVDDNVRRLEGWVEQWTRDQAEAQSDAQNGHEGQ